MIRFRRRVATVVALVSMVSLSLEAQSGCAANDSAAATAVRARLNEWVRQANTMDRGGMNEVWAPGMVGWFPRAGLFSDSAAVSAAGLSAAERPRAQTTYALGIADVVASGSVVVVHDVWTETRDFGARKVQRVIRGSELWRCQSDGRWRIARFVSAPEPWESAGLSK